MQCLNCGVSTQRLRRHFTSSLPDLQLNNLARWLPIAVPKDGNICHQCFELLSSTSVGDVRLYGHTMVCIVCGCSVRKSRHHAIKKNSPMLQNLPWSHPVFHQDTNYACHVCWKKYKPQSSQDENRVNLPSSAPRSGKELRAGPGLDKNLVIVPKLVPRLSPEPISELESRPGPGTDQNLLIIPKPEPRSSPELGLEPEPSPGTGSDQNLVIVPKPEPISSPEPGLGPEARTGHGTDKNLVLPPTVEPSCSPEPAPEPELRPGTGSEQNLIILPKLELSISPELSTETEPSPGPGTDHNLLLLPRQEPGFSAGLRPDPEPELRPGSVPEPEIILPSYRRVANTSSHCVFDGCDFRQHLHVIPLSIKSMLFKNHKFYIPRSARVCETHLTLSVWETLLQNKNIYSNFTASQIEDLLSIAKSDNSMMNFENVTAMKNLICHYWTGLTVAEFLDLLDCLPPLPFKKPKNALAIYLAKLRTGETDGCISKIFGVSESNVRVILNKMKRFTNFIHVVTDDGVLCRGTRITLSKRDAHPRRLQLVKRLRKGSSDRRTVQPASLERRGCLAQRHRARRPLGKL